MIFNKTIIRDIIDLLKYKEFYIEEENRLVKGDIVYDDIDLEFICKNINGKLSLTVEKMPISIDDSNIYLYNLIKKFYYNWKIINYNLKK